MEFTDKIFIKGLTLHTSIGCTEEERAFPQRIVCHIEAYLKLTEEVSLDGTVCYASLAQKTTELVCGQSWELVEHVAEAISKQSFELFLPLAAIRIQIEKFAVPGVEATGIEIVRKRKD